MEVTLTPAYGRDYQSAGEARKAYLSGKDWIIATALHPYAGKSCSCRDFPSTQVKLRFKGKSKFTFATYTE